MATGTQEYCNKMALSIVGLTSFDYSSLPIKSYVCIYRFVALLNPSRFSGHYMYRTAISIYRVIQEESAIIWEIIVCVILSKKVHMNMGPILNGYRDMVKRKYGPSIAGFSIQQFYVLPTQCIYVFCVDLRTNSDYFPI
jgi:hypothetical protein